MMAEQAHWGEIERLYLAGFARFLRVATAITGNASAGEEAVQEGFADALRHARDWAGTGSLEGWVWRCVVNRARKARLRPGPPLLPSANGTAHEEAANAELRARLAALPERQRLVVFLRYFADLGYREIAATLEIEVGTVSATLSAAHAALRTALEEVQA